MKIYKIDLIDLNCLDMYGFKKDPEQPAHKNNVYSLDEHYRWRFPQIMRAHDDVSRLNFRNKTNLEVSKLAKEQFCMPEYILLRESEYGKFEYHELLLDIPFYIISEAVGIINTDKVEISAKEASKLLTSDYIKNMGNLFCLNYALFGIEAAKNRVEKELRLKK